jgi:hypothetical protein
VSLWDFMDETPAIPLVAALAPFLVVRRSKLPLAQLSNYFCNCTRLVAQIRTMAGHLLLLPAGACAVRARFARFYHSSFLLGCPLTLYQFQSGGTKKLQVGS